MDKVGAALRRAAQRARELARRNGVPLVIWQDGKTVHIPPDQIEDLPDQVPALTTAPR
jgi:hypothetical protein